MITGPPMLLCRRAVGAVLLVLAALAGRPAPGEVVNRIVATIDGEPVTAYEVDRYVREHGLNDAREVDALETLITDRLIDIEVKSQGLAARDEEVDRYVAEIQARNGMTPEQFSAALAEQSMTAEAYRRRVKSEIEKAQLVNREIRQRVSISPEEIERYYEAHQDEYRLQERVEVSDIFFGVPPNADDAEVERVRTKAEEVRGLAAGGRDFTELARQFSEGPGAQDGGKLGTFGRGEMDRALEEALSSLKPGQVSPPVRAGGGFHLLRVEKRMDAGHRPLKEVEGDIRGALYDDALQTRFQNWLSRELRERHHVEVLR